ncbi:MAG: sugar ABC transporter substrate-binding protein [Spirochaetes bacterium]|nr:sugar ABC transporter substrate-binding protein [Spirochaetota bacterium]
MLSTRRDRPPYSALPSCPISWAQYTADKIKIGYICNNFNDTFQTYVMDAAKKFFAGKADVELILQDAQEDVIRQQDLVNTLISKGVKALIVVPVNTGAMEPIIQAAADAKIPLVFVNRNPFGENALPANVYYVGSQEIIAGQLQMEAMGKVMGGKGNVAILMGKLDNEGAVKRTEGNEATIKAKFPNIKVLAKETGNWQRDQGMSLTENWLTAYGKNLNGILANNDEMALGAVEALKAAGRKDVFVMGVDAIPDAKVAVGNGSLAATVLQDAVGQGSGAAGVAYTVVKGGKSASVIWVPFVLVNKANLSKYK